MTFIVPTTRTVLDTNVLASGFVRANPDAAPVQIIDAWRARQFTLVVSDHLLTELGDTFETPYFSQRLTPEQIAADLLLLRTEAVVTALTETVEGVATHPEDDLVLATAVSAGAEYLVTGDIQLQRLGHFQDVTILSPRAFLDVLQQQRAQDPER